MRIEEPFLRGHLTLWLAAKGAANIAVSVDGTEPHPSMIGVVLTNADYSHIPSGKSRASWTGKYESARLAPITVVSRPGVDIDAVLGEGKGCVAECKGEPTAASVKAGQDRTAFYAGLGQLIVTAGSLTPLVHMSILAIPNTPRFSSRAREAAKNPYIQKLGIDILMVDQAARVMGG